MIECRRAHQPAPTAPADQLATARVLSRIKSLTLDKIVRTAVNGSGRGVTRHGDSYFKGHALTNTSAVYTALNVSDGTTSGRERRQTESAAQMPRNATPGAGHCATLGPAPNKIGIRGKLRIIASA